MPGLFEHPQDVLPALQHRPLVAGRFHLTHMHALPQSIRKIQGKGICEPRNLHQWHMGLNGILPVQQHWRSRDLTWSLGQQCLWMQRVNAVAFHMSLSDSDPEFQRLKLCGGISTAGALWQSNQNSIQAWRETGYHLERTQHCKCIFCSNHLCTAVSKPCFKFRTCLKSTLPKY